MTDDPKIEVIRRDDLEPGDYIIVKCHKADLQEIAQWADWFFKGSNCRVSVLYDGVEVKVLRDSDGFH